MTVRLANRRLVRQLQRRVASGFFGDTATLIQTSGTGVFDSNNTETKTTVERVLKCSFTDKPSQESWRDFADVENVDAEIRFTGYIPTKGNRIKLTGRFDGANYSDDTFEIIGIHNRDVFGYVCALKIVRV